jgi:hypothetical protein
MWWGGPDYWGLRTIEGKHRGVGNVQYKQSSLSAKVKLLKAEILSVTAYNNNNNNNNNNNVF